MELCPASRIHHARARRRQTQPAAQNLCGSRDRLARVPAVGSIEASLQQAAVETLRLANNALVAHVNERNAELERLNHALEAELAERAHTQDELQRRNERLSTLHSMDRLIASHQASALTLKFVAEQATRLLRVEAANILLLRPDRRTFQCAAASGVCSPFIGKDDMPVQTCLAAEVIAAGAPVALPKLGNNHRDASLWPLSSGAVAAYFAAPLEAGGEIKGVLEVFSRQEIEPAPDWLDFLSTLAGQAAIALEDSDLIASLRHSMAELERTYDTTLEGWARALELRDQETEGHTRRACALTLQLARTMGIPEDELPNIRRGALLHDIGKMAIPDNILLKPARLTDEERKIMQQHTLLAKILLTPIEFLKPAGAIPYYHHERWDGQGYPCRLAGEEIPLPARIFSVVDVWDALTHDRPYRKAWPKANALAYIQSNSGTQFDPRVVEAFVRLIEHEAAPLDPFGPSF